MEEISLTIDGKPVRCRPGTTVLEAARAVGISIPTLCHHVDLKPAGACRVCLVEDEKNRRIMASCVTPAAPDMTIRTDSPAVLHHRANVIRLMMANHPESCILCDQGNRCELRGVAAGLGIGGIDLYPMARRRPYEDANPFIVRDLTKCILCGRCIRADRELVVVGAIDYQNRGFDARPATLHEEPLERSSCTFCGTCVSMCPTGALRAKTPGYAGSPETWAVSVCGFCGVGCSLRLGTADGRLVEVKPAGGDRTVNHATLCVRGHFEQDFLASPDRLRAPRVLQGGKAVEVPWEEAVRTAAERLRAASAESGPQSVAFLGSAHCTVEEGYLFQKIARAVVGTSNVLIGPEENSLADRLTGLRPFDVRSLEEAEAILVAGTDLTVTHPVLGYGVKRAARWKGVPLVVVDPLRTGLVPFAGAWLRAVPGGESEILDALAAALLEQGEKGAQGTEGLEEAAKALAGLDREEVCRRHGVPPEALEQAARMLAGRRIALVAGEPILAPPRGEATLRALETLSRLLPGNEAFRFLLAAGACNRVGALDMGMGRDVLPGRMALDRESSRRHWERAWGVRLSPDPGLSGSRLIREMEQGNLKALYVMGANPLRSFPQTRRVRDALKRLDLLVVQDILETRTVAEAHVVLPGAASAEKEGTFTNLEGRIQAFGPALSPPGEARPDWSILADLHHALSAPAGPYAALQDIRREIRDHVPGYAELPLETRENGRPRFRAIPGDAGGQGGDDAPPRDARVEPEDAEHPLWAVIRSPRCHTGSGTRTSRSGRSAALEPSEGLLLSPREAGRLGIETGGRVRVFSVSGSLVRRAGVDRNVPDGVVWVAAGMNRNDALELLPLAGEDAARGACRVRVERA